MKKSNNSLDSSEIEKLYRAEKKRIEDSTQQLEKEKCKAYLRLMDKHKQFLQGRIGKRMHTIRRLHSLLKKKQDQLLQKIEKVKSENDKDLRSLQGLDSEHKKLVVELKILGKHKRKK